MNDHDFGTSLEMDRFDDDAAFGLLIKESELPDLKAPSPIATAVRGKLPATAATLALPDKARRTPRTSGRLWWIASSAAVVLMVASVVTFLAGRQQAWAQVAETLHSVQWIHLSGHSGLDRELWLSPSRDVSAMRSAKVSRFDEHRSGVRHEFDSAKNVLVRVPINHDERSFESMNSVFHAIFRGDRHVGEAFAEDRIVEQERRSIEIDGNRWIEYEFTVEGSAESTTVVIRVDPSTSRPVLMRCNSQGREFQFNVDYPEVGPDDIYALNVPHDVRVEDRMPSPDLKRIASMLDRSREDLDNYVASVCYVPGKLERLVYRKGDKWRFSLCWPGDRYVRGDELPLETKRLNAWWKQRRDQYRLNPVMICDGRHVYEADYGSSPTPAFTSVETVRVGQGHEAAQSRIDTSTHMIEFQIFPDLNSYVQTELSLDDNPTEGPAGSILVTRSYPNANPNAFQTTKYWLDPSLGYAVVKYEDSDCRSLESAPNVHPSQRRPACEFKDFQQSPQGIWYPTIVVNKNATRNNPKDSDPPGSKPTYSDKTTYYHLDFTADLTNDLFTP